MFQKAFALLISITVTIASFAQKSSAANTRKILNSYEWELKYYLTNDKRTEVPETLKGLRLVFMPTKDLIYEYTPGDKETISIKKGVIEKEHFKYEDRIEEPEMIIDIDKLEEEGILAFTSEYDDENKYSVYEKVGKIKDKGYPSQKYEVEKLEVPMQRIHPELENRIKSLGAELKKTAGNLFFYDKNKSRFLLKDINFETTEYGIKYSVVYDTKDEKNRSYSYEFMPEHIDEITEVKVDPDSRVGQLKITLDNENCYYRNPDNKNTNPTIIKTLVIDYFKESANSFDNIRSKLNELSVAYIFGRTNRLDFLTPYLDINRKIWLSLDGNSCNYQVSAVDIIANKIYLHYNLEMVGLSSNKKGSYLTIIPLKDITGLTVERTKSKPNTLLMHSKKKGFETYTYSSGKYTISQNIYVMPLFNYGDKGWDQQRIERTLKQLIADDGGDNIKVIYND